MIVGVNRLIKFFAPIAAILVILIVNIFLCVNSFYICHHRGDQRSYVGIAAKIDQNGFKEYNLRKINVENDYDFITFSMSGEDGEGDLLRELKNAGLSFYDQPLFHAPPLFVYSIVLLHRLFAKNKPYTVVRHNESLKEIIKFRPRYKLHAQFYCVIVPIFFSSLVILFCFLLGKYLFSNLVGIIAALLMAVSPINILASQRIWADETVTFFVLAAIFFWYASIKKDKLLLSGLAGILLGCALLTKDSSLLALLPIIIGFYIFYKNDPNADLKISKFDFKFPLLLIIAFLVVLPWYLNVIKYYGTPWYNPYEAGISKRVEWFTFIKSRPWYTYLIGVPSQAPVYIVGYIAVLGIMLKLLHDKKGLFLSTWFLSYLIPITIITKMSEMLGPDHRYMLPAYPALAILTAKYLDNIRVWLNKIMGSFWGNIVISIIIILSCYWSIKIGISYSLIGDEIDFPF